MPFALINSFISDQTCLNKQHWIFAQFCSTSQKVKTVYRLFHNCIPKENRFTLVSKHLCSYERHRNTKMWTWCQVHFDSHDGAWKSRRNNTLISYERIHIYIFHPYQLICRWVNDIRRILAFPRLPQITLRHLQKSAATGLLLKKSFSI